MRNFLKIATPVLISGFLLGAGFYHLQEMEGFGVWLYMTIVGLSFLGSVIHAIKNLK